MKNLKSARMAKGYKQQDMADYLGIGRPSYARYEACEREPDIQTQIKLADKLDVTIDYLVGRSDTNPSIAPMPDPEVVAAHAHDDNVAFTPAQERRLREIIQEAWKVGIAAKQKK